MKISEITIEDVAAYLRLNADEYDKTEILAIMEAAKHYIIGYTGLSAEQFDDHADFYIAFMILCADMYDNRQLPTMEHAGINKVFETILGMHSVNLIGGVTDADKPGRAE